MERVSSQGTIFLRIALPTIWLTTILSLVILLGFAVRGRAQIFTNPVIWLALLLIFGTAYAFIHFILWKLYRVDMDHRFVYISNYFRTFKYPYEDILRIRNSKWFPDRVFIIEFKARTTFGKEVAFLASQRLWKDFLLEHPDMYAKLDQPN